MSDHKKIISNGTENMQPIGRFISLKIHHARQGIKYDNNMYGSHVS